ncbi:hypothetical protein QFW80_00575 [Luteimonas sp. M1R5S18]|uniref:Uncharacterized protein n=1 Tax=Luteimonas rhizosphaericola TaxID=3042024 RepID=A0ABT6JEY7_9GAMM|nr:hypothetical protein [Luteimonas rhizosphaericola]MDH5829020.1 hypothetical protein [Luteimonas rhizosphaericola]
MELLYRVLGALHLVYAWWIFGELAHALKEESGVELARVQWGIKTSLWLVEIALLFICGAAALLLEPSAHVFAWLALLAYVLVAFSNTVALEGPIALFYFSAGFYVRVVLRSIVAATLYGIGTGTGQSPGA